MEDKRWKWIAIASVAPITWGSTYFVTHQFLPYDTVLWGGLLRALPAGVIVFLLSRRLPTKDWWWKSLFLGTLNVGGFFVLIYVAGQRLPSSVASTVMSMSAATMIVLAWLLLRQRPGAARIAGATIGIIGVAVMLGGDERIDPAGIAASLGAMVASSLGFVLTTRWGPDIPALAMTSWQLLGGSLVLVPVALICEGGPPALTMSSGWGFAYISLVATAIAYTAWFAALRRLAPSVIGIIGLLNPATGVLLGTLIAGEVFDKPRMIGFALVMGGIVIGVVRPRQPTPAHKKCQPESDWHSR